MLRDPQNPKRCDDDEPQRHDGAKRLTDARGAEGLYREQTDQHDNGERQDVRTKGGCRHHQPFQSGQYRDRRRDRSITIDRKAQRHGENRQMIASLPLFTEQ